MRFDRISIPWTLAVLLGVTLYASAAIRPDSSSANFQPPPPPPPADAPASSTPPDVITPSMPLTPASTPMEAEYSHSSAGLPWASILFILVGLLVGLGAFVKVLSWAKQRYTVK